MLGWLVWADGLMGTHTASWILPVQACCGSLNAMTQAWIANPQQLFRYLSQHSVVGGQLSASPWARHAQPATAQ